MSKETAKKAWYEWATENAGNIVSLTAATRLASIPRWDLQLGGVLLGTIFTALMAKEKIAEPLDKKGIGFGNTLSALGVVACVTLGGGELISMIQDGTITNPADPSWIKVAANAVPYLAASLLDWKPATKKL